MSNPKTIGKQNSRIKMSKDFDITRSRDGITTYACKSKHPGLPFEKFVTGSRRIARRHMMNEMGFFAK